MGKPRGKLTPEIYRQIKEYKETHTIDETALHFGISRATIIWVNRYDNFKKMKQERAAAQREYMQGRKQQQILTQSSPETRKDIESPFKKDAAPLLTLPQNAELAPAQDSEPVTTSIKGLNIHQWAAKYEKTIEQLGKARAENAKLKERVENLEARLEMSEPSKVEKNVTGHIIDTSDLIKSQYDTDHIYVISGETQIVIPLKG